MGGNDSLRMGDSSYGQNLFFWNMFVVVILISFTILVLIVQSILKGIASYFSGRKKEREVIRNLTDENQKKDKKINDLIKKVRMIDNKKDKGG